MRVPLAAPEISQADIDAVTAVLRSGRLSLGPELGAFERAAAEYLGVPDAVAVSSGTAGLHLSLCALDVGPGDEVITPSFSFVASATAALFVGATPVFVDVDSATGSLDPSAVEAAITPQTRALVVVHVFGRPAAMDELLDIAARHDLLLIEDACEALGSEVNGRKAGTLGDTGVFAFYPNKQITTGEGGLVVARDPAVAARVRRLRNQGRDPQAGWFQHTELGWNYRLSDLHCALGRSQLARLDTVIERREELAAGYARRLASCPALLLPPPAGERERISWFAYVVRLTDAHDRGDRDRIVEEMAQRGIECGRYFAPIHRQPLFADADGADRAALPVTDALGDRVIALPFFNTLSEAQLDDVCDALLSLLPCAAAPETR